MSNESGELERLRAENARLIALLESHSIDWRCDPAPSNPAATPLPEPSNLSTAEKLALFRRLFRERADVHPVRWESVITGKSGYAPACANEWRPGICEKPQIKCADFGNRSLVALSDAVIYSHLAGEQTIGVYPLLPDDSCYFLAVDFDKAEWREDATAFVQSWTTVEFTEIVGEKGPQADNVVPLYLVSSRWHKAAGLGRENSACCSLCVGAGKPQEHQFDHSIRSRPAENNHRREYHRAFLRIWNHSFPQAD